MCIRDRVREIEEWTDVVQLLGVDGTVYGLHSDGKVSTTVEGNQEKLEGITGVRKIAGDIGVTSQTALTDVLGLMEDGTEMCIRDRLNHRREKRRQPAHRGKAARRVLTECRATEVVYGKG